MMKRENYESLYGSIYFGEKARRKETTMKT
jgi:hypothetical protein